MLRRGYSVSGSDLSESAFTASLAASGARVHIGHDAAHVADADIALATSAAPDDHVEIVAARARNIPVYRRRDFMGAVLRGCDTIAVAGAHGKTTTTSMIIHILKRAGLDPSFIVGGPLANWGVNAAVGSGPSFVIEADEYDNMFLGLAPDLAVVTNVEHDHPDFFPTPGRMIEAFRAFVERLAPGGELIACADDPGSAAIALAYRRAGGRVTTYGSENTSADWRAVDLRFSGATVCASILKSGLPCAELALGVPGGHNVLNAVAAMAAAEKTRRRS